MSADSTSKRGVLIAGNWKMHKSQQETEAFFRDVRAAWEEAVSEPSRGTISAGKLRVVVAAPYLSLERARAASAGLPIEISAQNAHWEKKGAFTGEVSPAMLREIGIQWSLVGHSERRQHFGETDETAGLRTHALLEAESRVILCVGETREEHESGRRDAVLARQLSGVFTEKGSAAVRELGGRVVIAYEPVWAIGTGLTATPDQAEEAHAAIRSWIGENFGEDKAQATQVLYGGSVKPDNIADLLARADIDGALVGGASLKPESFLKLVEAGGASLG